MPNIFVDGSLINNIIDGSYSILNRDNSGSDGNAYKTLNEAIVGALADDVLLMREGDIPADVSAAATLNKAIDLLRYNDEEAWIVANDNQHGLYMTSSMSGKRMDVKLKNGGALNKRAIYFNGATNMTCGTLEVKNYTGTSIYLTGTATGNTAKEVIINDTPAIDATINGLFLNGGEITIDVFEANNVHGDSIKTNTASDICEVGQCSIIGGTNDQTPGARGAVTCTNGSIEIHNILIANIGVASLSTYAVVHTAGTLTLHEGVINGNVHRPWDYLTSGTIGMGNVQTNKYIEFENDNSHLACASFYAVDSNIFDPIYPVAPYNTAAEYITNAFNLANAKCTFLPDDQRTWDAAFKTQYIKHVVNNGMELGCEGESSSPMNEPNPINVAYSGADTNVTLTITGAGSLLVISGDAGDVISCDLTPNSSLSGVDYATPYINKPTTGLITILNNHVDIACVLNGDPASWDDTDSEIFEDGVYSLSTGAKDIAMNRERYFIVDIDETQDQTELLSGAKPVSYFQALYTGGEADVAERLAQRKFVCAIGGDATGNAAPLNIIAGTTLNKYNLTGNVQLSYWQGPGYIKATNGEERIRGFIDVWVSMAKRYGVWGCFLVHHAGIGSSLDVDEFDWAISQLRLRGVPVNSLAEASAFYEDYTNGQVISDSDNFSYAQAQGENSSAVGVGGKWWTGTNPSGLNGEPFSEFDTDCGSSQSTHGPFHPLNLK